MKKKQNYLLNIQSHDPKSFWKYIGELGSANDRRPKIPWNIELPDGAVSTDKAAVMNKWKCHFEDLYTVESCDINVSDHETIDTGSNLVITENKITVALSTFKNGKATGYDNIPTEVLKNKTVIKYLLSLLNKCFLPRGRKI